MRLTEIAEKVQQLEALYSNKLANHADPKELRPIWKKIQDLRTQYLLLQTFESAWGNPLSAHPDLSFLDQQVLE